MCLGLGKRMLKRIRPYGYINQTVIVNGVMMKENVKKALYEAVTDTGIAAMVNIPLNFILLYVCIDVWNLPTVWTSVIMTTIFTTYAITRKTFIRLYFERKNA